MRSPRLQAAMRPPQALLVLVAVALFRPAATQTTCPDAELATRTRQANFVFVASLANSIGNGEIQLRVHAVLKGHYTARNIRLRADACTQLLIDKQKFLVFVRRPTILSAPPLPLTDENKKAVKEILCKKRCEPRVRLPKTVTARVKDRLELHCRASGRPQPKVKWFKDGRPLKISRNKRLKSNSTSKLQISHVRFGDAGRYECRAENYWAPAKAVAVVTVLDRKGHPRKPKKERTTVIPPKKPVPTTTFSPFDGKPCTSPGYCMHGGTCMHFLDLGEVSCQCAEGYKGQRCEIKDLGNLANVHAESLGMEVDTKTMAMYWGK